MLSEHSLEKVGACVVVFALWVRAAGKAGGSESQDHLLEEDTEHWVWGSICMYSVSAVQWLYHMIIAQTGRRLSPSPWLSPHSPVASVSEPATAQ